MGKQNFGFSTAVISVLAGMMLLAPAQATQPATTTLPTVASATANEVAVSSGSYANVVTLTLPKGNYLVWGILGGTDGATVNCNVVNGPYHMFDFTGLGEASFVAGVAQLSNTATLDLSCESDQSNVTMTFAQLQAQQVGTIKGTVSHN